MKDLRQTPLYAKYMEEIGWKVSSIQRSASGREKVYAYIKKVPFIGNLIKIQRPEEIDTTWIKILIRTHKPFQIIIEPINENQGLKIKNQGFKQSKNYFIPSKTIHIDLTKSEKQLLKEMHYKTRYNIKKAIGAKLKITRSRDIQAFSEFWQKCAIKQRGMFLNQKKEMTGLYNTFGKNAHIIIASSHPERVVNEVEPRVEGSDQKEIPRRVQDNKPTLLAGVLMVCTKNIAYYMFAAASEEGKKLFTPTLGAWEAIKLAKKLKCKIFDFEGIYDERFPIKSWLGFSRFKKSFGGEVIEYPGTFSKFMLPFRLFGSN